jgi:hypothetical protein
MTTAAMPVTSTDLVQVRLGLLPAYPSLPHMHGQHTINNDNVHLLRAHVPCTY